MSNIKHFLAREYSISETTIGILTSLCYGFNNLFRGIMYVGEEKRHKKYTRSKAFSEHRIMYTQCTIHPSLSSPATVESQSKTPQSSV